MRAETIEKFGLTSEQVAREMALGALKAGSANLAVANTGVADSVDPDVPSGTQCSAAHRKVRSGGGPAPQRVRANQT